MHRDELAEIRILSRLDKLTNYLNNLKANNFASTSSIIFIEDILKIIKIIQSNFVNIAPANYHNFENFLDDHILEFCAFIERTTPAYIPWSLLQEIEKICKTFIDKDIGIVIKTDLKYNYYVHNINLIDFIIVNLSKYLGDLNDLDNNNFHKTRIFTIPLLEKNNALLHSIFFHEIGHYHHSIYEEHVDKPQKILSDIFEKRYPPPPNNDTALYDYSQATLILKGAIREIYSDIYAYKYCGPSIIFALRYFYHKYPTFMLPSKDNKYYPPFLRRIRILFDIIKNDNTLEYFENNKDKGDFYYTIFNELNEIDKFLGNDEDITNLWSPPYCYAYEALENIIPDILADVQNHAQLFDCKKSTIHPVLFKCLLESIPPCEILGEPQLLVDILFAGWSAYFYTIQSADNINIKMQRINLINNLILKAVTQSYFMSEYKTLKNGNTE